MSRVSFLLIFTLMLGLLAWRFQMFYGSKPIYMDGQELRLEVSLAEEPELSNKGQKFAITDAYNQTIYVTAAAFPRLHYGEVIRIQGQLDVKKLDDGRIIHSFYQPKIHVEASSHDAVSQAANSIRERSKDTFESTLPPISASLLMGIVFGAKEHFPDDFFDALQATGVLHVIAASGMNVTFVSAALLYGFGYFMRRQLALALGGLGIIFYLFLVGFEPSIIRASLMGILAFCASFLGRQHFAALAVVISAFVMLMWQPGFFFDLGFQLSFLATLGIIFIKPLIPIPQNFFTETITTTLAAQVGTLPLLLGVFGQFGMVSLLVNALVLWIIPIVMLLGSLAAIIGLVLQPLAQALLLLTLPFLIFFEQTVSFFGESGVTQIPKLPLVIWVGYYFILVALILFKKPNLRTDPKPGLFTDL